MCFMLLSVPPCLECKRYSLFKDRVPNRNWQQAVNIVGERASLDKQEHSDHHRHTYTQPRQGAVRRLHTCIGALPKI